MSELSAFERRLAAGLEAYAGQRRSVDADAIARAAAHRSPVRKTILLRFTAGVAPAPRLAWRPIAMVAIVAVLTLALAVGVAIVGNQPRRLPAVVEPAGNGLIAYAHDGDIFVGDPISGTTTAIVSGPEMESGPIFSPDGTRIAFVRGDPWTADAILIVARVDGSDERVVMPAGYSQRGLGFAWTPDSASLVVNHDSKPFTTPYFDGELSLVDASGVDAPRLITPPLPKGPGGGYFGNVQAAPMFRPPSGDLILSSATGPASDAVVGRLEGLYAWDNDLRNRTQLAIEGLERYQPYYFQPWALVWSPDGSMIAFELGWGDREPFEMGSFVMRANGTDVRHLERIDSFSVAWSPDGTTLAFQRCGSHPGGDGSVIVLVDVASGSERILEATSVLTKREGAPLGQPAGTDEPLCGYYQGPTGRAWDYEGWSWSPDGRSIVMLERSGTRPMVVDVETGEATELPWEADSAPSWQRILPTGPGRWTSSSPGLP